MQRKSSLMDAAAVWYLRALRQSNRAPSRVQSLRTQQSELHSLQPGQLRQLTRSANTHPSRIHAELDQERHQRSLPELSTIQRTVATNSRKGLRESEIQRLVRGQTI